uniref:protein-secreting ATPase n=1 Tax=uncultured marine bacterium MedDCM-OCT-S01-C143 TaxID=743046 RepID=D6PCB9_9BACT|nr:general secretory pathway protein E [uncultured marine bacterium MedDCM-OCT-S01-C143]
MKSEIDPELFEHNPSFSRERLGQILVRRQLVSEEALDEALLAQKLEGGRLGEILVAKGLLNEEDFLRCIGEQLELDVYTEINADEIAEELVEGIPISFAKQYCLCPISVNELGEILVATPRPMEIGAIDDLAILLDAPISLVLAPNSVVMGAINSVYDRGTAHAAAAMEEMVDEDLDAFAQDIEEAVDLLDSEDEAPIIRLVNSLISQAIKEHASDIHIEPAERELLVRFRIDGILYEKIRPPKKLQASITSRLKIQAGLNIAEKRLPQDGRIRIKMAGKDVDIRVATAPTSYGERITLRLLDRSNILLGLGDLGFSPENEKELEQLIRRPHGIILVTGPTGSGKSTTLYACLSSINRPDLNILTIEDPVEYQLPGVSQTQVNPKINLTFASGLRSFLRHDPDVIMVGEIRDLETAEIAIQAALTGHLVLSTIHTNDAASAVTRLVDMGVEPFLVASSIVGILAQRLVRTVCPECKQPYVANREEVLELGLSPDMVGPRPNFFRGPGCVKCLGTGYLGRSGIHELLTPTDEVRQLVLQNVDAGTIKKQARKQGMRTMREDGARKVLAGITSSAELLRVTQEDPG